MTGTEPVRLAFIGSGNWARKYHFRALAHIRDNCEPFLVLHGISSLDSVKASRVRAEYGFNRVYTSVAELAEDRAIDALAIAVPPDVLVEVIERVLPMGIPILSEKPPGISLGQATYLGQIVNVPNVVAFNRRYAPLNNQFKALVDEIANPFFVEGHFFRHDRHDLDFVLATGIHWINYLSRSAKVFTN